MIPKHHDRPIRAGDVIPQDRSHGALEAQDVLGDLLPVLTAVQPAELNSTLTAIATALQGRGEKLGRLLVNLDRYLKIMNPHTSRLVNDIGKLGKVALEYNGVAPDIFASLKNLETGVKTVVQKRANLDQLLTVGTSTSNIVAGFLSDNRSRLIDVAGQSNKIFNLLAEYSPEYSCLFNGVQNLDEGASSAIYDHSIHLEITVDNTKFPNQGAYHVGNQPKIVRNYGPSCFGLPNHVTPKSDGIFQIPGKYRCLDDGARLTTDPCGARTAASRKPINPSIGSSAEDLVGERDRRATTAHHPEQGVGDGDTARRTAAARSQGGGQVRGLLAPLIKLIAFLLVTLVASYVLASTISNQSYGSTNSYKAIFSDVTGLTRATTCASPVCGWAVSTASRSSAAPVTRASRRSRSRCRRAVRCPRRSPPRCATATWSGSATSTSSAAPGRARRCSSPAARFRSPRPAPRSTSRCSSRVSNRCCRA